MPDNQGYNIFGQPTGSVPDFTGAANQEATQSQQNVNSQTAANRPNIFTDFGSQTWSQGPNGQWAMHSQLSPELQGLLGQQNQQQSMLYGKANGILGSMDTSPLDFSGLSPMGTGESARNQAINAAYGQATSRLDPQWAQMQQQQESQLANQGLDLTNPIYQTQMGNFGRQRNDAYGSAMNSAIGQGTAAGAQVFNQDLMARQQGMSELLKQRTMPYEQLQALMGGQHQVGQFQAPGFNAAGVAHDPQLLAAMQAQGNYELGNAGKNIQQQQVYADAARGAGQLGVAGYNTYNQFNNSPPDVYPTTSV